MPGKVVSLADRRGGDKPPADRILWRCQCGCFTHFALESGELECAQCGEAASPDMGEWRRHMPDAPNPAEVQDTEPGDNIVTDLDDPKWSLRRVLSKASVEESCAAIVIQTDGSLSAWCERLDSDERVAWLDRKLAEFRALVVREA